MGEMLQLEEGWGGFRGLENWLFGMDWGEGWQGAGEKKRGWGLEAEIDFFRRG